MSSCVQITFVGSLPIHSVTIKSDVCNCEFPCSLATVNISNEIEYYIAVGFDMIIAVMYRYKTLNVIVSDRLSCAP